MVFEAEAACSMHEEKARTPLLWLGVGLGVLEAINVIDGVAAKSSDDVRSRLWRLDEPLTRRREFEGPIEGVADCRFCILGEVGECTCTGIDDNNRDGWVSDDIL